MSVDTALLQLYQIRSVQSPRKQDMDSLLDYLRGVTGVDFLKYPERDMWPNWSSEEYRERIIEEYVTTDPRAVRRDYFSILLEGALLSIYHGIRLRFRRGQDEVSLHRRPVQKFSWCIGHVLTIYPSKLLANVLRRTKPVTWKPSVPPLQWRCPLCFQVSRCSYCFTWKALWCELYSCSSSRPCSPRSSRSLQPRGWLRFMRPQQRTLVTTMPSWTLLTSQICCCCGCLHRKRCPQQETGFRTLVIPVL